MIRDLRAESLALVRISNRRIARGTNHSGGARSHRESSLLERKHCDLEALAFFANQVFLRHPHILQRKVSGVSGADAQLAVNCSRSESLHASLNDEAGHARMVAFSPLLFLGPAKEKKIVGRVRQA